MPVNPSEGWEVLGQLTKLRKSCLNHVWEAFHLAYSKGLWIWDCF